MRRPAKGLSTRSVHGGESRKKPFSAVTNPIIQASSYVFKNTQELVDYCSGEVDREEYGRYGNPTISVAEQKIADLEGGEDALIFSSGMNAFTSVLLAMLSSGGHVIILDECYRRSRQFCTQFLPRYNIDVTFVKTGDYKNLTSSINDQTRLIISESPTNPFLNIIDLEKISDIASNNRIKVLIDGTFATPYNQKPLDFGVDLVLHSATKYLGGHNDLLAGVIVGSAPLIGAIREFRDITGGISDPNSAYLLIRGLKTFALRMEQHNTNGMAIAQFLDKHPRVRRVYYPGLKTHPNHKIARGQMSGFGGVVSFEIEGDMKTTSRFVDELEVPYIAPSLGGVESLVEQPAIMSYYEMDRDERLQLGIKDELVRYSTGIDNAEDLILDLEQALEKI